MLSCPLTESFPRTFRKTATEKSPQSLGGEATAPGVIAVAAPRADMWVLLLPRRQPAARYFRYSCCCCCRCWWRVCGELGRIEVGTSLQGCADMIIAAAIADAPVHPRSGCREGRRSNEENQTPAKRPLSPGLEFYGYCNYNCRCKRTSCW